MKNKKQTSTLNGLVTSFSPSLSHFSGLTQFVVFSLEQKQKAKKEGGTNGQEHEDPEEEEHTCTPGTKHDAAEARIARERPPAHGPRDAATDAGDAARERRAARVQAAAVADGARQRVLPLREGRLQHAPLHLRAERRAVRARALPLRPPALHERRHARGACASPVLCPASQQWKQHWEWHHHHRDYYQLCSCRREPH